MVADDFLKLFGDLDQGVMLLDGKGKIEAVNAAYLRLTGRCEADVLGERCAALHRCFEYSPPGTGAVDWLRGGFEPEEAGQSRDLCQGCPLKRGLVWQPSLVWLRLPERTEPIPVSVSYSRLSDSSGRIEGLLVFFQPIQDLHVAAARSLEELCRLGRELSLAAELEHGIFPYRWEAVPGLELAAISLPLRPVGGDLVEGFRLSEGSVMYVADLSGKSLPGAVLLPTVRQLCHRELRTPPPASLHRLNRALLKALPEAVFLALSVAFYDGAEVTLTNAGNEPPWVYRHSEAVGYPIQECQGMVLGVCHDASFESATIRLEPGDLVAMWTDGVGECLEKSGRGPADWIRQAAESPSERLEETLRRAMIDLPRQDDASILAFRLQAC
ncbi:SpoIIE family protein phosphatase [bacterium]|nr:SpoIIE family protein phosphatase [bacterium]